MKGFIEFEASNLKTAITAISVGAIKMIVEHKDSVEIVTDDCSYVAERETYSEICAKIEEAQADHPAIIYNPLEPLTMMANEMIKFADKLDVKPSCATCRYFSLIDGCFSDGYCSRNQEERGISQLCCEWEGRAKRNE